MVLGREMMKKLSYLMIGLIAGIVIGTSTSAFAAIGDKVEATFAKFTFVVNGTEKPLDADPLVYQGSTYLPVRTVANILGYDVTYKADSKTIEMSNRSTVADTTNNPSAGATSGGNTVNDGKTLEQLNNQIDSLKSSVEDSERMILISPRSEAEKDKLRLQIAGIKDQIAELEKQKAALEAQPTPTP